MKKTYIIPQVLIVRVAPQRIISASTDMVLSSEELTESGQILTKQNNYNVWSDDWSAE